MDHAQNCWVLDLSLSIHWRLRNEIAWMLTAGKIRRDFLLITSRCRFLHIIDFGRFLHHVPSLDVSRIEACILLNVLRTQVEERSDFDLLSAIFRIIGNKENLYSSQA